MMKPTSSQHGVALPKIKTHQSRDTSFTQRTTPLFSANEHSIPSFLLEITNVKKL